MGGRQLDTVAATIEALPEPDFSDHQPLPMSGAEGPTNSFGG
ncbi:MAG: hypothetical protein ACLQUY_27380 [Ktedonobacterales bacterium]